MNNPIRRNRNIGKTQGGRVQNGKASEKWSRFFNRNIWQKLSEENSTFQILKENTSREYYHPCNGIEILEVLNKLPKSETECVRAIVLRKISKTDEKFGVEARRRWSCVILNSFPKNNRMTWTNQPGDSTVKHYSSWCNNWVEDGDKWYLVWTNDEIKKYYLYHLLLHEIGHINEPKFSSRKKRESFAENYVLEWAKKLNTL
jgi:hypothetical protein